MADKIIDFRDKFSKIYGNTAISLDAAETTEDMLNAISNKLDEAKQLLNDKRNVELQEQKRINSVLEKECRHLKKVISKCIPVHTIIFLLINMAVISAVSVLLTLRFFMNVYIIDAYYLLCLLLASATLFCTALKSLSEWRKFLHGLSERKEK